MNNITLPELMPGESGEIFIRKRKQKLPARLFIILLFLLSFASLALLGVCKLSKGSPFDSARDKFFSLFPADSGFGSIGSIFSDKESESENGTPSPESESVPLDTLPTLLPVESESPSESAETEELPKESEKEPPTETPPENAVKIIDAVLPENSPKFINMTARKFNSDFLSVMTSSVIPAAKEGPSVLIIHTHTSEGYLPSGISYAVPSENPFHNGSIKEVGEAFLEALEDCGISAIHITDPFDRDGSAKAYIKSRNRIREILAEYPSVKYVVDLGRSFDSDSEGNLLRTSVSVGSDTYAPIRLAVSGGGGVSDETFSLDLSLALKIYENLELQGGRIQLPVLISDAVCNSGLASRTLKAEIGSAASSVEEAKRSARLLGEIFALMINR